MKRDKKSVVLEHPSFTFWVTDTLRIWPCFVVQRALCNWIVYGPIPDGKTNRVHESPVSLPTPPSCVPATRKTHFFLFFNQGLLGHIQVLACAVSSALLLHFWLYQEPAQSPFLLGGFLQDTAWKLLAPASPLPAPFFLLCPNPLGTFLSQSFPND